MPSSSEWWDLWWSFFLLCDEGWGGGAGRCQLLALFWRKGCHFHYVLLPFSVLKCLLIFMTLCWFPIFYKTWELKSSGLHPSPPLIPKLKAGSLELVVLRWTSSDPRNESASPRTLDSYSYQETLIQTPSQRRTPYFPHEMLPRNAAARRVCMSSPELQSLMHILTSVLPNSPDVSTVLSIPYLSIINPRLVSSSGKVSGYCKNPKYIPYPQALFLKEIFLRFPPRRF